MKILYICALSMVVQSLFCMDEKIVPVGNVPVEHKFPGIAHLRDIGFVRENVIAVLGKAYHPVDEYVFVVRDIKNKNTIIEKRDKYMCSFAIQPNGKHIALKQSRKQNSLLTVFDAVNGEQVWDHQINYKGGSIVFCPEDFLRVALYEHMSDTLILYSQSGKQEIKIPITLMFNACLFAHHPTKKEISVNSEGGYSICSYDDKGCKAEKIKSNNTIVAGTSFVTGQSYNIDGSCIAMMTHDGGRYSIALVYENEVSYLNLENGRTCLSMLFHPNNKILLLLNTNQNFIECWDYKKIKCTMTIPLDYSLYLSFGCLEKRLAVSGDGKKLFVASSNKCIEVALSDDVLYGIQDAQSLICKILLLQHSGILPDI